MAVKMRLRRMGAKKKPFYRIVIADERAPRDGKFIDRVGTYNPLTDPSEIKFDEEKTREWLKKVCNLLIQLKAIKNLRNYQVRYKSIQPQLLLT